MNETSAVTSVAAKKNLEDESNLFGVLIVLAKHKKKICALPLAVAIATAAVTFTLPNVYKAGTKLLPPQQPQSGAAAILSQLGGVAGAAAGASGIKNPSDLYIAMLKSRTVADKLIARFELKKVYETSSLEKARSLLEENSIMFSGKDGVIVLEVENEDKTLAMRLANGYVDELLRLTRVLALTEAAQRRLFYERQLESAKNKLADAEVALKGAIDTNGLISVDSETKAVVETIARLRAQIAAKEIELNTLREFVTPNNPGYKRSQQELNSLQTQFAKLQNGAPTAAGPDRKPSISPGGLENIKIVREVKYQQMLYELLAKQYEAARLDEAKESSIIQVLDPAVEPERKSGPKRAIIVIMSAVLAMFAGIAWALVVEAKEKAVQIPARALQLQRLKTYLGAK